MLRHQRLMPVWRGAYGKSKNEKRNRNIESRKSSSLDWRAFYGGVDFGRRNFDGRFYAQFAVCKLRDRGAVPVFVRLVLQK